MKKGLYLYMAIAALVASVVCLLVSLPPGDNLIIPPLVGILISILSLFSLGGSEKRNVIYLVLNIIIITLAILFYLYFNFMLRA